MLELCVCVPARNEAKRLPILLDALAAQVWEAPVRVVIALNNTDDDSRSVIASACSHHGGSLEVHLVDVLFPSVKAHAGSARRLAMDTGLSLLRNGVDGMLVSTDADTRPPKNWLACIASAAARGADIVGGRIEIDPLEPIANEVAARRFAWERYWRAVRDIEDEIDPLPWDPAPRHGDHTGASLAITAELYRACGGVPPIATGEDVALVRAALACGGKLAHPEDVFTFVSPRCDGRASGGMAQAMRALSVEAAEGSARLVPSYDQWRQRAKWRRNLRALSGGTVRIAREEPLLPPMSHDMMLDISA
ncbi:glycosyltransferase [Sphingobium sp.]|uniref:glycosyltransferase n=1 Tax=Sphingobium sp. TaxID=1912891 RepID=UPI002C097D9E|nr:glycosyltransferase [Sphingobium sp.]HUD95806.1 glycosyltransferase [Sphingobium sp.]